MKERLTEDYYDDMQKIIRHYAKSDNIDLNTGGDDFQDIIDRLAEYEIAEVDGRLAVLPCKIGTLAYNNGWIPVDERLPEEKEWKDYNKQFNCIYLKRLELAYKTDTVEYIHGYYDGEKWIDKRHNIVKNVVAWRIHEPYRPEKETDCVKEVRKVAEYLIETYPCDSCNVEVCYRRCYKMTLWAEKAKEKLAEEYSGIRLLDDDTPVGRATKRGENMESM